MSALRTILSVLFLLHCAACPVDVERAGPDGTSSADARDADAHDGLLEDVGWSPPGTFRLATYNVHLLFDGTCDSGRCGPGDFEVAPDAAGFAREADRVASAVSRLGADIVLLQEVENEAALDAVNERLQGGYPYDVIGETGFAGSVDVALMSRFEIIDVLGHRDEALPLPSGGTTTFARELLEVHLDVEGQLVVVFVAHFKSKYSDDAERRLAEATAARRIVLARAAASPEAIVVLGGDLNDTPSSAPLVALAGDGALVRLNDDLPDAEDWTVQYQGTRFSLDHLLVPVASSAHYVQGSVAVARDGSRSGFAGSDHAAVRATFTITPP